MSLLKGSQQAADQNLTIFLSSRIFLFPPRQYQPPQPHVALQKDWEKAKSVLDFWGARFFSIAPQTHTDSTWLSLRWSTVEVLHVFSTKNMKFSFQNVFSSPMRRYSFVTGIFALPKLSFRVHLVMQKEQSGGRWDLWVYCQDQTQRWRRAQCLLQILTTRGVGAGRSLVWGQFLSCWRGFEGRDMGFICVPERTAQQRLLTVSQASWK